MPKVEKNLLSQTVGNKSPTSIKKKSEFEKLKKFGKRFFLTQWLIVNVAKNTENSVRAGYTVSGKVGSAVIRNKLKRWSREIIGQLAKEKVTGVDINVVFKPKEAGFYKKLKFAEVQKAWVENWQKISRGC